MAAILILDVYACHMDEDLRDVLRSKKIKLKVKWGLREQYNLFCLSQVPDDRGKIAAPSAWSQVKQEYDLAFVQLDQLLKARARRSPSLSPISISALCD